LHYGILQSFPHYSHHHRMVDAKRRARMSRIIRFLRNESGATAIEYGLIAAGISIAIIAVVNGLGTQLNTTFSSVSTQLR
jgi:pilus assembly protein Flp/PilA